MPYIRDGTVKNPAAYVQQPAKHKHIDSRNQIITESIIRQGAVSCQR